MFFLKLKGSLEKQKLRNRVDIWYNCRLDEYLGLLFLYSKNLPCPWGPFTALTRVKFFRA